MPDGFDVAASLISDQVTLEQAGLLKLFYRAAQGISSYTQPFGQPGFMELPPFWQAAHCCPDAKGGRAQTQVALAIASIPDLAVVDLGEAAWIRIDLVKLNALS